MYEDFRWCLTPQNQLQYCSRVSCPHKISEEYFSKRLSEKWDHVSWLQNVRSSDAEFSRRSQMCISQGTPCAFPSRKKIALYWNNGPGLKGPIYMPWVWCCCKYSSTDGLAQVTWGYLKEFATSLDFHMKVNPEQYSSHHLRIRIVFIAK